ncbi:sensor histidine kinase [Enterococcus faecalis]|uniref:sensor histidine kinase n=1 Tax=Enterococcus faecalis TaxID=1351 RepID=UPI00129C298F|nr:HAMP domain-containing sensor histidine kinase [Enterococcus faecalis]MEB8383844.1 HAMP domain-containing histidine kinase [Enterococcus faecalis]
MKFLKNSLTGNLIQRVAVIFILSILSFLLFYRYIFPTYYYWQQEKPVKQAQKLIIDNQTEKISEEVVTIKGDNWLTLTEDDLNNQLNLALTKSGITLSKFWLDKDAYQTLIEGKTIQRLYHQSKLKNDFYALFFIKNNQLYLVGRSIPSFRETVSVLFPLLFMATIVILFSLILLIVFYVRKELILPIRKMEQATRQMSALNFRVSDFETKNELGILGDSMKQMADSLQEYEQQMLTRNEQLKEFSANIAHELKTPLAVSQLLIDAEKMSLPSPTFLAELDKQLAEMNHKITQILAYSMQLKEELSYSTINIESYVKRQKEYYRQLDPTFTINLNFPAIGIYTNETMLDLIFDNLITNALKYSTDKQLAISGQQINNRYEITFQNHAQKLSAELIKKLTEPFVVGEDSRNAYLSGTGLGLTIVKQAVENLNGFCTIKQVENIFFVTISLPL